ncbi:TPA_asm: polyprotein [Centaurea virus 1]|uniref:RNA-directed RNA polymerase n=1 Tax=Centaurea virus 1 TaxID=2977962 RepID=A0A9N6YIW1_9RHAB|nr:TPA_asm: polyprotein [Centaurea virus 1]
MDLDETHPLGDDERGIHDEKVMTDLHLANALNLDHVEYLLFERFEQYNIYISDYQKEGWRKVSLQTIAYDDRIVGMLAPTQDLLLKETTMIPLSYSLYKRVVKIIGESMKARGMQFPLVDVYQAIIDQTVVVSETYLKGFKFTLHLVCMISEAARGGSESVYRDVRIENGVVIGRFKEFGLDWSFTCNNFFSTLCDHNAGITYYGSFDSLLLIMDTLGQRLCLEIGMQITMVGRVPGTIQEAALRSIIKAGDMVLQRYGNAGYELIAMFEALVVGVILSKNQDPITDKDEFLNSCIGEVEELSQEGELDEDLLVYFDSMKEMLFELSNKELSNVFCIYRIWGHPRVNTKSGMQKVMERGTMRKPDPKRVADIILQQFRKMFLMQFYQRKHRYPPCTLNPELNSHLRECIENDLPISVESSRYCLSDFNNISILKLWELPETYDVCHILNDKAVSPNRSELYKSVSEGKGTIVGVQRRGIVRWLMSDSIRCKEFLEHVDEYGIDEDSSIIGMYEKERELKIKARMFSLMSEKMRMYVVLTEGMIAEHILPYFSEITMKDPLHVMIKKLWEVSRVSHTECLDPIINIDFEKWNLNMRNELTYPLFKQMDEMFGYNSLISRTHSIFEKSLIYVSSGKYLPKVYNGLFVEDPPMLYTGHIGGFEGLRQKGWTVATVCLLAFIAERFRMRVTLLGQGDNQVVRIYMPHFHWDNLALNLTQRVLSAKRKLRQFIVAMDNYFDTAGLPIKVRETWKSTRLYMYGKMMYLDGDSLPQWVKKLLRTYALSNEGTLTVSGVIGTVATNLCASAHVSEKPDILYVLFLLMGEWSLDYLLAYHPFTRKSIKENSKIKFTIPSRNRVENLNSGRISLDRLKLTLLLIPTAVGGSVTIPITGFIIRGFPDNASEGYAWLNLLRSVPSAYKDMLDNWFGFLPNDSIEGDMLVQAPWSLNHKKPPTPGLQSREVVRDWILGGSFGSNQFIGKMKASMEMFDRKQVCRRFLSNRVNPLILHELYNSFPQVYLDGILRRVENTRSIRKLSMLNNFTSPIIEKLMDLEHNFFGYLYWRGFCVDAKHYSQCATVQCRVARNTGWNLDIHGLTTPHPLEYAFQKNCQYGEPLCDGSDYIFARVDPEGDFSPYLGSCVKTKVVSLQDIALRAEPLVASSSKLLRFARWLNLGENSMEMIRRNIKVVCDVELFNFADDEEGSFFSGSVEHRFNPSVASEGCFINYAPQIGKRVFISSDNMPRFGRGQSNYTLHFQALFAFCQYDAAYSKETSFKHYHLLCDTCIVPVEDNVDDIHPMGDLLDLIYTEKRVDTIREALGYLDKKLEIYDAAADDEKHGLRVLLEEEYSDKYAREGVHRLLALRAAMLLMYACKVLPERVAPSDLQMFPRIYAYKVSTSYILELVTEFLYVIKMSRAIEEDGRSDFTLIRSKLMTQLNRLPLIQYQGIGSLCLGRTWSDDKNELPAIFNHGEWPEDCTSFLSAIRTEIVGRVGSTNGFTKRNHNIQVPGLGLKRKECLFLILHQLYVSKHCNACPEMLIRAIRKREEPLDCFEKHVRYAKKRVTALNMPLELAVKSLVGNVNRIAPSPIVYQNSFEMSTLWKVKIRSGERMIKRLEDIEELRGGFNQDSKILLPNDYIYKWDFMLSHISYLPFENVIVIGDGFGSCSLAAARRFPHAQIYPTALLEKRKFIPQDMFSWRPLASRIYSNVRGDLLENVVDNVLHKNWIQEFQFFLSRLSGMTLIITDFNTPSHNKRLVNRVLSATKVCNEKVVFQLHKVYFGALPDFTGSWWSYMNVFNEVRNLDAFVSSIDAGGLEIGLYELLDPSEWKRMYEDEELILLRELKEVEYQSLVDTSVKVANGLFYYNFVMINDELINKPAGLVLYNHLKYITMNFKGPLENSLPDDRRKMLEGMHIRVLKGLKMLLVTLYGREICTKEYFQKLMIDKVPPEMRITSLRELATVMSVGDVELKLSTKEMKASYIFRGIWKGLRKGTTIPNAPESISEMYSDEVLFGKELNEKIKPF